MNKHEEIKFIVSSNENQILETKTVKKISSYEDDMKFEEIG